MVCAAHIHIPSMSSIPCCWPRSRSLRGTASASCRHSRRGLCSWKLRRPLAIYRYSEATITVRSNSRIRYTPTLPHVRGFSCPSQGSAHIGNGTRAASRSVRSRVSWVLVHETLSHLRRMLKGVYSRAMKRIVPHDDQVKSLLWTAVWVPVCAVAL